jgi:Fur family transcriptional regulator, zinc uptake regulator
MMERNGQALPNGHSLDQKSQGLGMPEGHEHANMLDQAEKICRGRGGRLTRQRRIVLTKLLEADHPLTAYELLDLIKPSDASITPASIYRSLDFLVEMGLVHRLESTRSFVACEHPDHPHAGQFLVCRECGMVVEAEDTRIVRATRNLGERHGFTLDYRTVELIGLCGTCRSEESGFKAGTASRSS